MRQRSDFEFLTNIVFEHRPIRRVEKLPTLNTKHKIQTPFQILLPHDGAFQAALNHHFEPGIPFPFALFSQLSTRGLHQIRMILVRYRFG